MDRWLGKVAVVTGASSGIGAAITKDLVKSGLIVIGLARRQNRVEDLLNEIPTNERKGQLHAIKVDISSDDEVNDAFAQIEQQFGGIHILINNAGFARNIAITDDGNELELKQVLNTNLWGLVLATKRVVSNMKKHNIISGHIVNINSVLGHTVTPALSAQKPILNVYPASKYGITAITEVLRQEFNFNKLKTKITSISPGLVRTDMINRMDMRPEERSFYAALPALEATDVAQAVHYVLGTPPNVQVHELIIKPNGEFF